MKNKFLLGAIAGVTSLIVAVPLIAQMSSAQGVAAPSSQPAVHTHSIASAAGDSEVNDPAGNDQNEVNDAASTNTSDVKDAPGTDQNEVNDASGSNKNEPEDGSDAQDATEQPGTENPNN